MNNLNLDAISSYSGIGANTNLGAGFGGGSGIGFDTGGFTFGDALPSVPGAFGGGSGTGGGGGFLQGLGNFLGGNNFGSSLAGPLLSGALSRDYINQAARGYGQSAYQATGIGALAGKNAAIMDFAFGNRNADLAQQRRYDDSIFQLNLQKSKPFQDLVTKGIAMNMASRDAPGAEMRSARFQTMFG